MRAPCNNDESPGGSQPQGQLPHFPRAGHVGNHGDKPHIRRDLGSFLYPDEFRVWPWRSVANGLRRLAVVVLHVRGQQMAARIENARNTGPEDSVGFVGRVHRYSGIDSEKMVEPARMIAMSMRDRRE